MHRLKMRSTLLAGSAALLGLAVILFSTFHTPHAAQATTVSNGWKKLGTAVSIKKSAGTTEWVLNMPLDAGKAIPVKGNYVIVLGPTVPAGNGYNDTVPPKGWRVVAYSGLKTPPGTELRLSQAIPGECAPVAAPIGAGMTVWTGPCNKPVVGPGFAADLSGVSDIVVDAGNPAVDLYHCIARTDIAAGAGPGNVKTGVVCFDASGALANGSSEPINSPPGEGTAGGGVGPPPPPPYSVAPPSKGIGTYDPGADSLITVNCFPDVGKSINIISRLTINVGSDPVHPLQGAHAQLAANGKTVGSVEIYSGQTNAACDTLTPAGAPGVIATTVYPASPTCPGVACVRSSWRTAPLPGGSLADYDGDGCTDSQELWVDKPGAGYKCPDDPWNPFDVGPASIDASGTYDLTAIATRQDVGAPGFYYDCKADIQQAVKALTARVLCYIDNASVVINPAATGGQTTCLPALAKFCGDGISGAPPPGETGVGGYPTNPDLFDKIGAKQTVLTGVVDNAQNVMKLSGCFLSNPHNPPAGVVKAPTETFLGDVYVSAIINLHTGHGQVNLWTGLGNALTMADCQAGTPPGPGGVIPLHIVRQAMKAANRDSDNDGCPDKKELTDAQATGGLRDPYNHYDYFDPTGDGTVRINDILATVQQFHIDDPAGVPDMASTTDRTGIPGDSAWNLGPPNGQQRIDDILAAVKHFHHDCAPGRTAEGVNTLPWSS